MDRPNLFDFATSELSQDAFLCWLLSSAPKQHRAVDEPLHRTAAALLSRLLVLGKVDAPAEYEAVTVIRQYKRIDVLVLVNDDLALLIEDKTATKEHSDQLRRYLDTVRQDFPGRKVAAVFFKTGDQSNYRAVEEAGFTRFLRPDFLALLDEGERLGVRSDIYADFHRYLRDIEEAVNSYRQLPVKQWGHVATASTSRQRAQVKHCWAGFFMALQDRLGDGDWREVANPSGGFMGFWWHRRGDKYLQLEEDQLCFKIIVKDGGQHEARWTACHNAFMAANRDSGLAIRRRFRRAKGTWMTVAVLDEDYRQAGDAGLLDLDKTVALLKRAEAILDSAA